MSNRHVIGRLLVEISANDQSTVLAQQQEIGTWARSPGLWQTLSVDLDKLVPDQVVVSIPRLELAIEAGSEAGFQQQLRQALVGAVTQFIREHSPVSDNWNLAGLGESERNESFAGIESAQVRLVRLALYFLETGALPAHIHSDEVAVVALFLNDLDKADNELFVSFLRRKVRFHPVVWQRLIYAIGVEKAARFVLMSGRLPTAEVAWLHWLANRSGADALADFWRVVLIHSPLAIADPDRFRQRVQQQMAIPDWDTGMTISQPGDRSPTEPTEEQPAVFFVKNAGLVLLGLFLPQLFTRCSLLDGNDFVDDMARHRAIQLLHYLATGETAGYEFDLTLNKVLCNQPQYQPVPYQMHLTATELTEADDLLRAAISHWDVLKNTSLAGLRETFLQRDGKLSPHHEGGWRLQVERRTVDILLDRLPPGWGYSLVRLPWMPTLLFVEW